MEAGTLLSHIDTDLVTREQLALVETPEATRSFKPVPHIELIETLERVLRLNQITIRKEQFALRRDGATLFGVRDFCCAILTQRHYILAKILDWPTEAAWCWRTLSPLRRD
jgi:hypothetical protein